MRRSVAPKSSTETARAGTLAVPARTTHKKGPQMTAPFQEPVAPGMVEVSVDDPEQLDRALDDAVATITKAATLHRTGIMITRTGPGQYIVRANPAVPYGLTRQQHQ